MAGDNPGHRPDISGLPVRFHFFHIIILTTKRSKLTKANSFILSGRSPISCHPFPSMPAACSLIIRSCWRQASWAPPVPLFVVPQEQAQAAWSPNPWDPLPREGHPGPTIVHVDGGLLNAMGLPNPSYKDFQDEIDTARAGGVPVIASIFGSFAAEFAQIARSLKADAFELNLSCPHAEKYGSELGRYPDLVESVTGAVKAAANVPVWVKLTPNTADILELGLAAQRGGADAIVAINTLKAMAIDIETGYPDPGQSLWRPVRSGHQTCGRALCLRAGRSPGDSGDWRRRSLLPGRMPWR